MKEIIIDTDGRQESLEALLLALEDKTVHVKAITMVTDRLSAAASEENVQKVLKSSNACDVKVYAGAARAIVGGKDCDACSGAEKRGSEHAVNALIRLVKQGETEIITLGPLTNIALAFAKDRAAMAKVKRITMLAGTLFHGDVGPMSERNICLDAYSADAVFKSGAPVTVIPVDVGNFSQRMKLALHPENVTQKYEAYTRIETAGELTYGASVNDVRDRDRKEFVSQNSVLHPFNCEIVADNCKESISMEV